MSGNIFGRMAADALGVSDIGKILSKNEFNLVDGDNYIMNEDDERIYAVIKTKADEYVFTNRCLIHVDAENAMSKKKVVKRYEYAKNQIHGVTLETAGTVDLDVELKFCMEDKIFSIDVDKRQLEHLKDIYKALFEIGRLQVVNKNSYEMGVKSLELANGAILKTSTDADYVTMIEAVTQSNFSWMNKLKQKYGNKEFGYIFEKYMNN